MTLDKRIERKRTELLKFREDRKSQRDGNQLKLDELEAKKSALHVKVRDVLRKGVDFDIFSKIMREVNDERAARKAKEEEEEGVVKDADQEEPYFYNSIAFSHEVLLLNTVHMMEIYETLLHISVGQGKKLAKFVERRKIALREQNAEYEVRTVNKLSKQYETTKKLEDDYRQAIHAQQIYIAKMEWKTSGILLPIRTLAATTSEFIKEQRPNIFLTSTNDDNHSSKMAADWARSMRNLMEMDGAFPPPDQDDLLPSIDRRRSGGAIYDADYSAPLDRPPMEFIAVLNDNPDEPRAKPRRARRVRSDSIDTASTAGEEFLAGIQDFFFRGPRASASSTHYTADAQSGQDHSDSRPISPFDHDETLTLDDSTKDWASHHGPPSEETKGYGLSLIT